MPRFFSRLLVKRESPLSAALPQGWQPLYYPEGATRPQPPPSGLVDLLGWPDNITAYDCLKYGLEAWLGMHAMRREGCQECIQCSQPTASLILEFYTAWSDFREDIRYIGASWWRWHTTGVDEARTVRWFDVHGTDVVGNLAYAEPSPIMKSLHYRYWMDEL